MKIHYHGLCDESQTLLRCGSSDTQKTKEVHERRQIFGFRETSKGVKPTCKHIICNIRELII